MLYLQNRIAVRRDFWVLLDKAFKKEKEHCYFSIEVSSRWSMRKYKEFITVYFFQYQVEMNIKKSIELSLERKM